MRRGSPQYIHLQSLRPEGTSLDRKTGEAGTQDGAGQSSRWRTWPSVALRIQELAWAGAAKSQRFLSRPTPVVPLGPCVTNSPFLRVPPTPSTTTK